MKSEYLLCIEVGILTEAVEVRIRISLAIAWKQSSKTSLDIVEEIFAALGLEAIRDQC